MAKVLIVEDEKAIVDIIAFNLKREGYEVEEGWKRPFLPRWIWCFWM